MRRGLVALLTAEAVSMIGTRMTSLALPWFVFVTTGSAGRTGLVAFAETLPYVLACALGGPLLDRVGARRASVAADATSALVVGAIPALQHRGLTFPVLLVLVAVAGALRGSGDTAKRVVFPRTVTASGIEMTRATSLYDGLARLATLLGAPLAGVLIWRFDAPTVLLIDAATFAFGALVVGFLVTTPRVDRDAGEPYLRALHGGLAFLRRDRLVAAIVAMLFFTNLFDAAYTSVFLPVWAREIARSPVALGAVMAVFAVGAVLGNAVFTAFAPRVSRFWVFAVGFVVGGGPRYVAAAMAHDLWVVYAVSFAAGVGIAAINPILGAVVYERVPEALMARVQGLSTAVAWAGIPLGGLVGGWAIERLGLAGALLTLGGLYLTVTVAPFVQPTWRQMDVGRKASSVHRIADQHGRFPGHPRQHERRRAVPGQAKVAAEVLGVQRRPAFEDLHPADSATP
jgi:MFS family permease